MQRIVFDEWKQGSALDRGQYCPSAPEPFIKTQTHLFLFLSGIIMLYMSGSLKCSYICSQGITMHCVLSVWRLAARRDHPDHSWCGAAGGGINIAGGLLSAPLLWSSTKHIGTALGGLWILDISSAWSVWRQIYLSSHPLTLRLSWSIFHCVHPDGFYRLDFSCWFFFKKGLFFSQRCHCFF